MSYTKEQVKRAREYAWDRVTTWLENASQEASENAIDCKFDKEFHWFLENML